MFPTLIDLGTHDLPLLGETHLFLPTYGLLFALGILAAWWWLTRRTRSLGVNEERVFNLTFYSILAGIIGAKVLLVLIDWRYYLANPLEILATLRMAGVLIGGVIAGALTFAFYARRYGMALGPLADAAAAPLALAQAVGRLGCFSAGCCWGAETAPGAWCAVRFTNPVAHEQTGVPLNVRLFPTQLIEMAFDLVLVVVLTLLWRRRPQPAGTVFWVYVLLYATGRGIIEFWRGDLHRGLYFDGLLSTSQMFALVAIAVAGVALIAGRLRRARSASA